MDPEVFVWQSGSLEAWSAKAQKKGHIFQTRVVFMFDDLQVSG